MHNSPFLGTLSPTEAQWHKRLDTWLATYLTEQSAPKTPSAPQNLYDAGHDITHAQRVLLSALEIASQEPTPTNTLTLIAAAYFHDIVNLPKNSPQRAQASRLSADKAQAVLTALAFPEELLAGVHHAIEAHSYSAKIPCQTLEAQILQDADRLEALGSIGIARCFYTAGKMSGALFHPTEPLAQTRPLDDTAYALDHFFLKLFSLPETMQTQAGKQLAKQRVAFMMQFTQQLLAEVSPDQDTEIPLSAYGL